MKLTEAIHFRQPLFESFKDLKNTLSSHMDEISRNDREYNDLIERAQKMASVTGKREIATLDPLDIDDLIRMFEIIIKHPYIKQDVSFYVGVLNRRTDFVLRASFYILLDKIEDIIEVATRPEKQDPQIEKVSTGRGYTVFRLDNYAAARKACNQYNTRHCIGSSDTTEFNTYNNMFDSNTYAITIADKRLVLVHSGNSKFLITSHDNKSEFSSDQIERGAGLRGVIDDFSSQGLGEEETIDALYDAMPNISKDMPAIETLIDFIEDYYNEEEPEDSNTIFKSPNIEVYQSSYKGNPSILFYKKELDIKLNVFGSSDDATFDIELMGEEEYDVRQEDMKENLMTLFGVGAGMMREIHDNNYEIAKRFDPKTTRSYVKITRRLFNPFR